MASELHRQRLDAVLSALAARRVRSVIDLGCGDGALLERLVGGPGHGSDDLGLPDLSRIVGIDEDRGALGRVSARVRGDARVSLRAGSVLDALPGLGPVDAAVLVEVIEHLDPSRLHALERRVFAELAPPHVVITTPNADFNPLLGVPARRMRHPGHRFEWGRARFRDWARSVADRHRYEVIVRDVPAAHPRLGGPTQMAVFDGDGTR